MSSRNTAASVRARLLAKARADKRDFNLVLIRYALERLLYRLSVSAHADHFLLKGALLFDLWFDFPHRPTRNADLLGYGSPQSYLPTPGTRLSPKSWGRWCHSAFLSKIKGFNFKKGLKT